MASVKLRLKTNKAKKNGEAPIVVQIVHKGKSTEASTGRSVHPDVWDKLKGKVKGNLPNKAALNAFLGNEKRAYEVIIDKKLANDEVFTPSEIVKIRKGTAKGLNVVANLDAFIVENPEGLQYNTLRTYKSTLAAVKAFDPNWDFAEMDIIRIGDFERFLREKLGNSTNTVHGRLKVLRKLSRRLIRQDKLKFYPFDNYTLRTESSSREYLTKDEVIGFRNYKPKSDKESLVRDLFLFACYTGMRFGDLVTLTPKNLSKEDGQTRLKLKMGKTNQMLAFSLSQVAIGIVTRYNYKKPDTYIFPVLTATEEHELPRAISSKNALCNKVIKQIATHLEINKNISFHVARHTFATLSLTLGIPIEVVSKLLGHQNLKETQIYAKIMDKAKDEAMSKWDHL